jgi:hypothetical protein
MVKTQDREALIQYKINSIGLQIKKIKIIRDKRDKNRDDSFERFVK